MTARAAPAFESRSALVDWPSERMLCQALLGLIGLCIVLQLHLAWAMEVNWDEFHYLSLVYEHARGDLDLALQTIHVHFFRPLLWLSGNEIRQVEAGRMAMLGFHCGTAALLYTLSRHFFPASTALLVVLAYVASGNSIIHGASFRADPLGAFLIMLALVAHAREKRSLVNEVTAVIAPALALLVTVKVVFYAPVFVAILAWQLSQGSDRAATLKRWTAIAVASLSSFAVLYLLHRETLAVATDARSAVMLSNAASVTLLDAGLFPRAIQIARHMLNDPVQTVLWVVGSVMALGTLARQGEEARVAGTLLLMSAILACLIFYRNAFPYFFPFILPPAALLIGFSVRQRAGSAWQTLAIAVALALFAIFSWNRARAHDQDMQQAILETVHDSFDGPVATIDRNGMVSSFPREGFFMSTWGLRNYRDAGTPLFPEILKNQPVPLLILNSPTLEDAVGQTPTAFLHQRLFSEDRAILRQNFIQHQGKVWVAGKTFEAGPQARNFFTAIPGRYRLESDHVIIVDGAKVEPGYDVMLTRGDHVVSARVQHSLTLRWADAVHGPSRVFPEGPAYKGFSQ